MTSYRLIHLTFILQLIGHACFHVIDAAAFVGSLSYNSSTQLQLILHPNPWSIPLNRIAVLSPSSTSASALHVKQKKQTPSDVPKRERVESPLELFVLYATPWRNPNSIFVYLFLIVYALGKYSEAHPPNV